MMASKRMHKPAVMVLTCCFVLALAWSALYAADTAPAVPKARLVIKRAVYGDIANGDVIDVTKILAKMVKDDALSVDATNANFTDPAVGVVKTLEVVYYFNGKKKFKTVNENETLTISNTGE